MNHPNDLIAAIATPLGEGGLGVIRLSGSGAIDAAARIFHSQRPLGQAASHTLHHGRIQNAGEIVDDAVAAVFRAPASYTGEDVVEFSCHGSPIVLKRVLNLCFQSGARPADPGEFTLRAFLNGKMDLAQAEAVADLIGARSERARQAARDQLDGALSNEINGVRERLIHLLARLEASLDFAEEDIPDMKSDALKAPLDESIRAIQTLLGTQAEGQILRDGLRVALVGRPNVGKSSLFNGLLVRDRAIVTDQPGTTRDVLEETLQWNGFPVVLMDTAGVRPTKDPVEREGVRRTHRAHRQSDVVLWVVEAKDGPNDEDRDAVRMTAGRKTILVLNKSDLGVRSNGASTPDGIVASVKTSAVNGEGLDDLKNAVLRSLGPALNDASGAPVVTKIRHVRHLENALVRLQKARTAAGKISEEAIAVDIREALRDIGFITGEEFTEEMLNSIFSQFCIGK